MENVIIRKAKKEDLDDIIILAKQLWDTEKVFDSNLVDDYYGTKKGYEELLKDIKSRKIIFLVASYNEKIVGFVDGYPLKNDGVYKKNVFYLNRLSVLDKYRRFSIGTALIDEIKKFAKEKDCAYIKINAFINNIPAVSLYKKKDFNDYSTFYMMEI